jgi:hypothetical protein
MIITLQKLKKGRLLNMKDMGIIQGSAEQAVPLIIGKDTVYVHTDIEQVFKDNEGKSVDNLFQYHEIQYNKDEYIKLLSEKNGSLDQQLTDTQLALCEIYEGMV